MIERKPKRDIPTLSMGPVLLDEQSLRDIDAVFKKVTDTAEFERPTDYGLNSEYKADGIDDILNSPRPVTRIDIGNLDLNLGIAMDGVFVIAPSRRSDVEQGLQEIERILEPRRIEPQPVSLLTTRGLWLSLLALVIGVCVPLSGFVIDPDPPLFLGLTVQFAILWFVAVIGEKPEVPRARASLFDDVESSPSFIRRWNTELTLALMALAVAVSVVTLALT